MFQRNLPPHLQGKPVKEAHLPRRWRQQVLTESLEKSERSSSTLMVEAAGSSKNISTYLQNDTESYPRSPLHVVFIFNWHTCWSHSNTSRTFSRENLICISTSFHAYKHEKIQGLFNLKEVLFVLYTGNIVQERAVQCLKTCEVYLMYPILRIHIPLVQNRYSEG